MVFVRDVDRQHVLSLYCFLCFFDRSSVAKLKDFRGQSCAALGAYVAGLGPLSGPVWAVLGGDQVEKWPKPERESDLERGPTPIRGVGGIGALPMFSIDP